MPLALQNERLHVDTECVTDGNRQRLAARAHRVAALVTATLDGVRKPLRFKRKFWVSFQDCLVGRKLQADSHRRLRLVLRFVAMASGAGESPRLFGIGVRTR